MIKTYYDDDVLLISESAAIRIDYKMMSCSYPRARQFELIIILQGCTTLPTRREDHAAHPTDHIGQRGTPVNRSQ